MDTTTAYFLDYADEEFDGKPFNGLSFMATIERLDPDMAFWSDTHEGYSAWSVALHVAYYKYFVAKSLGAAAPIEPYPFEKGSYGFGKPATADAASWKAVLDYSRKAHSIVMAAIRAAGPEKLAQMMPEWDIPYGKTVAWLASHDVFHGAQIRNMGVPGLKESSEI